MLGVRRGTWAAPSSGPRGGGCGLWEAARAVAAPGRAGPGEAGAAGRGLLHPGEPRAAAPRRLLASVGESGEGRPGRAEWQSRGRRGAAGRKQDGRPGLGEGLPQGPGGLGGVGGARGACAEASGMHLGSAGPGERARGDCVSLPVRVQRVRRERGRAKWKRPLRI